MRRLVVDVGARNGMLLLPESYTRGAKLVAFEANAEEHAKLVSGETDAVRAGMAPGPRFAEEQYFNCALWDRVERRTLYITAGPGACTLLGATDERVTRRMFLRERHGWSSVPYCDLHTRVKGTMGVDCQPLDSLLPDKKVDFLKLDIVGAEHELPAAADRFRSAEIQPHADHDSSGSDKTLQYAGDAYSMPVPHLAGRSAEGLHRAAAIALCLAFRSFCMSLLRDSKLSNGRRLDEIEMALSRISMGRRLKTIWDRVPDVVYRQLNALSVKH